MKPDKLKVELNPTTVVRSGYPVSFRVEVAFKSRMVAFGTTFTVWDRSEIVNHESSSTLGESSSHLRRFSVQLERFHIRTIRMSSPEHDRRVEGT